LSQSADFDAADSEVSSIYDIHSTIVIDEEAHNSLRDLIEGQKKGQNILSDDPAAGGVDAGSCDQNLGEFECASDSMGSDATPITGRTNEKQKNPLVKPYFHHLLLLQF